MSMRLITPSMCVRGFCAAMSTLIMSSYVAGMVYTKMMISRLASPKRFFGLKS